MLGKYDLALNFVNIAYRTFGGYKIQEIGTFLSFEV